MQETQLTVGDHVLVRDVTGAVVEREVVSLSEEGEPILASPDEAATAKAEGREPRGTGWPQDAIVGPVNGHAPNA
jgi:hypothetical protein